MKKLLLLLLLGGLPMGMSAEGEYPNVLVIQQTDGTEKAFLLEESTLSILPSTGKVTVASANEEKSYALSGIKGIKYDYRDPTTLGISGIPYSDATHIGVYGLDGRKVCTEGQSMQESLRQLPHGVYVVKMNGRTLKIAK